MLTLILYVFQNKHKLKLDYKRTMFLCTSYDRVGIVDRLPYCAFSCSNLGHVDATIIAWSLYIDNVNPLEFSPDTEHISDPDVSKALRRDLPVKLGSGEAFWIGVPHAHMLKFLSHFVDKGFVQCDDFVFVRFYELSGKFHVLRLEENVQALMNICRSEHKCLK